MISSVMRVDAGVVNVLIQGVADRHSNRNVKLEDPSQAFLAEKLDMKPLTRSPGVVHEVSLKAVTPLIETLNDEICHA